MVKDHYSYGIDKEKKIAHLMRTKGAKVQISNNSKGAADLRAKFSTGTKWDIQVKSSRKGTPASPSSQDLVRLKQGATKRGATPVIAKVTPKGTTYTSARSGRKLTPPSGKR